MSQSEMKTIYRRDYHAPSFVIDVVNLCFDLGDEETRVENTMQIRRRNDEHCPDLFLHGEQLQLDVLSLDDEILDESAYSVTEEGLLIKSVPSQFSLTVITLIKPQDNKQLSGLYRSNGLYCTQCEAEGFRRITYFLDRPDVLAEYTTTIRADRKKFPILLSNGNLVAKGDTADNKHWATWHDPFKKPSYLFALVAGDLAMVEDSFTTQSGKSIILRIYVEPGNEAKCQHAMQSLKKAMAWDESVYGREYDLDIFMIVAVSDFNMGAMENKGLNIFNSKYILVSAESATDQDFAGVESVVAHEYFHNWTGNRVTCRDWFQLSLKEGLTVFRDQEFSRDMNSRDVNRIYDVKVLRNAQFPEDAGPMAHPVRPDSYMEINNFYTATVYNKGAEVIRMQHTLLGEQGFRRGMDLYFDRHDGEAVTIDDFLKAMEDANTVDFSQMKRWYSQAGTPQVTATFEYDPSAGRLDIHLTQETAATPGQNDKKPFYIPLALALFDSSGQRIEIDTPMLELKKESQSYHFYNFNEPPVVSLLRGFSAPIQLQCDYSQEQLMFLMRHENDGFSKWEASQQLAINVIRHEVGLIAGESKVDTRCLLDSYRSVLKDSTLDLSLKAEILAMPSFEDIARHYSLLDVDSVVQARDRFAVLLGTELYDDLLALYDTLNVGSDVQMSANAYARRQMKNICLFYLMNSGRSHALSLCLKQFQTAQTMTDEVAALGLLLDHHLGERESALTQFYQKWQSEELVLDKWFMIQARSRSENTPVQVKALLSHPKFSLENPNRVRALIGTFCTANPRHFHQKSGSSYRWLSQIVSKVDAFNPQLAARLVMPLTQWRRYDEGRQQILQEVLLVLLQCGQLSKDVAEIVSKSIEQRSP